MGDAGTLVHLSGRQTITVDAMPSKIVAQMSEAGISVRVPARVKEGCRDRRETDPIPANFS